MKVPEAIGKINYTLKVMYFYENAFLTGLILNLLLFFFCRQVIAAKSKHNKEVLGIRGNTVDDVKKIILERQYKLKHSIQRTFGATLEREIPSVVCWRPWHMLTIPNVCRWDTLGVVLGEDITFNLVSHSALKSIKNCYSIC